MIFETHEVAEPYKSFVESIFHYKHFKPDHSIERVVPTGHVFLLFELDGFQRHTYDNETLEPNANFVKAWVSGIHQNYLSISAHEDSEMFVIQFKSFGARPFLHVDMDTLADRVVSEAEIPKSELIAMHASLRNAETSEEKFAVADDWLRQHFDLAQTPPDPIVNMVSLLQEQPASKLKEVLDTYDGTQKHLISQFRKFVGLTPKQYQRVMRFNDVFAQMQKDQFLSWADIAQLCGYSDQSHFIREFKNFSGFSPKKFLQQDFDEDASNFFPLD